MQPLTTLPESRTPLPEWPRPSRETLMGEVYRHGRPKFAQFPTVTDVVTTALCPVAAVHNILHGRGNALIERDTFGGVGNLFHNFVAHIKTRVAQGKVFTDPRNIRWEFDTFARGKNPKLIDECVRYHVEPWCLRKFAEITSIRRDANIFFEVSVGHTYVPFTSAVGRRTYPLMGRIDEVDIDNSRLIERTTMGLPGDTDPPKMKDYQLWLLWRTLCSVEKRKYLKTWQNIDFRKFDLVVETPYKSFTINNNNPAFERLTQSAYAWIHDITFGRMAIAEAYANRACSTLTKLKECGLQSVCYRKNWGNPTGAARGAMKREFRELYAALTHELLWNQHLFRYQIFTLEKDELEELGLVSFGNVVSAKDNKIEIEFAPKEAEYVHVRQASGEGDIAGYYLVFGTFNIGLKTRGFITKLKDDNKVVFDIENKRIPEATAMLTHLDPEMAMYGTQPWFLTTNMQRDMYRLQKGTLGDKRAKKDSVIQMLESIFGTKQLERG